MAGHEMQRNATAAVSDEPSVERALRDQILAQMAATAAMNGDAVTRLLRSTSLQSDERTLLRQLAIHIENAAHCIDMLRNTSDG